MFLMPKRIYFAVREAIGEDDKVKHLDRLNNDTNYIEKAIQFGQQKSYKSQQEDSKNSKNNIEQTASIEGKSLPDGNNVELLQDGPAPDTASGVSPSAGQSFIFPPVNHSEPENVQQQHLQHQHQQQHHEEISLLHRGNATENLLDIAPHSNQPKPSINHLKNKIDVRPKLRCSFCKATYARSYFLMEHLRKKHNYRPSLGDERSAREALEKAKIGCDSIKAKEPLPSFRGKRKNVDEEDESDIPIKRRKQICKKPLPSFRGKRKNLDDVDESDIPLKRRKQMRKKPLPSKQDRKKPLPSFRGKRKNTDDIDECDIPSKRQRQVYLDENEPLSNLRPNPLPSKLVRKKPLPSFQGKKKNTDDTNESSIPSKPQRQVCLNENEPLSNLRRKVKNKPLRKNPFYKKPLQDRKKPIPTFRGKRKNTDDIDECDIPSKRQRQVYLDENEPLSNLRPNPLPSKLVRKKPLPSFQDKKKNTDDTNESSIPSKPQRQVCLDENEPLSNLRRKVKNKPLRKNPFYKKPLKVEQRKELLPAQVKLRKLNIRSNPFFKKFPKLVVKKF